MEEGFPHTTCDTFKPHMPAKAVAVFASHVSVVEGVQPEDGARGTGFGLNSLWGSGSIKQLVPYSLKGRRKPALITRK